MAEVKAARNKMAKKASTKGQRTSNQRFTSLERLVRAGFRQTEVRFRRTETRFTRLEENSRRAQKRTERRFRLGSLDLGNLRKEINSRFTVVEDRIDRLATHVDGFIKLHLNQNSLPIPAVFVAFWALVNFVAKS